MWRFNIVLDPEKDYDNYRNINNNAARDKILEIIESKGLVDIYRNKHPDIRRFTLRKRNFKKQARLDFFLISENLVSSITKSYIEPGYRTDHSAPMISMKFNNFKKGKGLWKFNNSLLYDKDYSRIVENVIENVKKTVLSFSIQFKLAFSYS